MWMRDGPPAEDAKSAGTTTMAETEGWGTCSLTHTQHRHARRRSSSQNRWLLDYLGTSVTCPSSIVHQATPSEDPPFPSHLSFHLPTRIDVPLDVHIVRHTCPDALAQQQRVYKHVAQQDPSPWPGKSQMPYHVEKKVGSRD